MANSSRKIDLFLGSASPRRKEILSLLGIAFECRVSTLEEYSQKRKLRDRVRDIAQQKLYHIRSENSDIHEDPLLCADTLVAFEESSLFFGKPKDRDEAKDMLQTLSGRTHQVATGVCLQMNDAGLPLFEETVTNVTFKTLSDHEIQWYLDSEEWLGVAGAYRIQGRGGALVESISGCHWNVVGLPMNRIFCMLQDAGIIR